MKKPDSIEANINNSDLDTTPADDIPRIFKYGTFYFGLAISTVIFDKGKHLSKDISDLLDSGTIRFGELGGLVVTLSFLSASAFSHATVRYFSKEEKRMQKEKRLQDSLAVETSDVALAPEQNLESPSDEELIEIVPITDPSYLPPPKSTEQLFCPVFAPPVLGPNSTIS